MPRTRTQANPRYAVVWAVLNAELDGRTGPAHVVDAGGGTGGFAVPLAQAGHQVTVVDPSPDALAALARRAAERGVADRIIAYQGDADDLSTLVEPGTADVVLCHSVLEVVDDPDRTLTAVAAALRPGGCASVLVANRVATVLARALAGHFHQAQDALAGDLEPRRYDLDGLATLVTKAGLVPERWHGVRVLADLVPGAVVDVEPDALEALVALELALSERPPYRDIATQLHVLARR
ncbi:methyltransferase domain-containing protein [Cryptosporangium aurantiacum]|uniref:Methyltransferase domain-containing protein n=1 Tax=Cryptosporangium aurantiacum TaxID=134849 RepID=A0A1M7I2Z1_9ACTN|nr:methyltransferase domain-containing protein [Cryptosporangium aurantiacum]SHM35124.1 Methyltransferase domain-containing protein [Cryptosporangium aurantiacum]